jgi:hypothetical protein
MPVKSYRLQGRDLGKSQGRGIIMTSGRRSAISIELMIEDAVEGRTGRSSASENSPSEEKSQA